MKSNLRSFVDVETEMKAWVGGLQNNAEGNCRRSRDHCGLRGKNPPGLLHVNQTRSIDCADHIVLTSLSISLYRLTHPREEKVKSPC